MKVAEIRELSVEELLKKIDTTKQDLADLKFKHSLNQLENPMTIRTLRREIAQMNTIVTEKRMNEVQG
ncbi:MAG: 50S ribosomal protein L29 [Candidatus Delongbacteria bacterium]|jgi:large subunit ribosomal protein L29|nr:50S ribosomal protein L29 [Candidatus Delongbacteria bacterium]MDD4204545.1 50S ribosomal protein L29 [Candidatus Delongbacteria bacterium]MDY0017483.1 50S ribosomal protein L29 [Candidatus Delongbacteria bacterium]